MRSYEPLNYKTIISGRNLPTLPIICTVHTAYSVHAGTTKKLTLLSGVNLWVKIWFSRLKYCAEGGGERASAVQQKSARFHGLPDSEIYTTEYFSVFSKKRNWVYAIILWASQNFCHPTGITCSVCSGYTLLQIQMHMSEYALGEQILVGMLVPLCSKLARSTLLSAWNSCIHLFTWPDYQRFWELEETITKQGQTLIQAVVESDRNRVSA